MFKTVNALLRAEFQQCLHLMSKENDPAFAETCLGLI